MMADTGIMELFNKLGDFTGIGGSYKYELMVYPDLDIGVINGDMNRDRVAAAVGEILANEYVRKVSVVDTINFDLSKRPKPKGYWVGIEIPYANDDWGIDCWLQQPDWVESSEDPYANKLEALGEAEKDLILAIKYDLIYLGLYGKRYFSSDVYDSVLGGGVRSVDDFYKIWK